MVNKLVNCIIGMFGGVAGSIVGKYIFIFVLSLFPILELRGGLVAAAVLGIKPLPALLICLLANALIIPFVLFLVEGLLDFLCKMSFLDKIISFIKKKALQKKGTIEKYGYLGVMLFVAVPLPGSGAWTGCFLAVLLGLDKKKSFYSAFLGILISAAIMMIFSYGILNNILN